jgi:hypothetical protein
MKPVVLLVLGLFVSSTTFAQELHLVCGPKVKTADTINQLRRLIPVNFLKTILESYYAKGLGFFCRQEIKMQQAHIPVTFRLGSMDYCNQLEQKPGYR